MSHSFLVSTLVHVCTTQILPHLIFLTPAVYFEVLKKTTLKYKCIWKGHFATQNKKSQLTCSNFQIFNWGTMAPRPSRKETSTEMLLLVYLFQDVNGSQRR